MTLREWLQQNHSENCYFAGPITETVKIDEEDKPKQVRVAEVWRIPVELLNGEIESKPGVEQ